MYWDKSSNEYGFNIYYLSSDEGRGSVLINAELTPQISSQDIQLAERLLSAKLRKSVQLKPGELRANPEVVFGSFLTNFQIDESSIHASIPSDYYKPIILDWRMDGNVDDFVGAMLNNVGVNMNLELRPVGDEETVISVPINLEVNSPVTFGKITFDTHTDLLNGWDNNLDYPVTPYNLVILRRRGNTRYFENVPITSDEIAIGGSYSPDSEIRTKLNSGNPIQEIWIDYSLDADCNECNQEVKRKIVGGTSGSQIQNIEIQVLNPLEYTDAYSMKLLIKSIQADPNGVNEITFPAIDINEDNQALSGNQLFVPEGKELSYNYQVVKIQKDGKVKTSKWLTSNSALLVLGETQMDQLFPVSTLDELEQKKDSLLDSGKKDLLDKGLDLLDDLLKGKKKDEKKDEDKPENNENTPENNENNEGNNN